MVEIMVTMMVEITTGGHASPRPPTCYVLLLLMSLCCFAEKTTAAATSSALRRRARPWEGAHRRRRLPLAIFCDQVFFDYDPSSSTSLLSSAMGQTKAKNRNGNGGDWSETQWRCLAENQRTRWDS